ncbi:MAG: esterase/lipase family protein [Thermoanaerobaculia bacterium]
MPTLAAGAEREPVVLLPGLTGTVLGDPDTGRIVWGKGNRLLWPRDGGYGAALPIDGGDHAGGRLAATAALQYLRLLGLYRFDVYAPVTRLMEANGYQVGDLRRPRPDDTFFYFVYDWRRDTVELAHQLLDELEGLRRARGEETLRVNLVAQSGAARIARYLIRYGDAALEEAEGGRGGPPQDIDVERLVLVGAPNGGAVRTLKLLLRGRRYLPLGRQFQPEVFLTFPSLIQDLPAPGEEVLVDAGGRPLAADLYDPATWQRFGWGFHDAEVRHRLASRRSTEVFGDMETRERYMATQLARSRRLHELLSQEPRNMPDVAYYAIESGHETTPTRAVVVEDDSGWCTRFHGDRKLRDDPYLSLLTAAPGDGHATLESQEALPAAEASLLAAPPVFAEDRHFRMILDPGVQRRLLEFLAD